MRDNEVINILIVGDSIGTGVSDSSKNWITLLQRYLENQYHAEINITNVSMGGKTSYAGYVRTMTLDDGIDYNLAIICYGQNDDPENFSLYYESIIRTVRSKFPDSCVISILESSQKEYTEKMEEIRSLADYYGILVADMIEPFTENYDNYTDDGIHPNDEGQIIYAEVIERIIDSAISKGKSLSSERTAINENVNSFDTLQWFGKDQFERVNERTFTLMTEICGILGMNYCFFSGDNQCEIYIDDALFQTAEVQFNHKGSQRYIIMIGECMVADNIALIFDTKEQADGFYGICFSKYDVGDFIY